MTNPYATSSLEDESAPRSAGPTTERLWLAFVFAPLIAPLLAAGAFFLLGLAYQARNPDDPDDPMSLFLGPLFMVIIGTPASYFISGLIGMPTVFWLRQRGTLNFATMQVVAVLTCLTLAAVATLVGILFALAQSFDEIAYRFGAAVGMGLVLFLGSTPCAMITAATFWLIGIRGQKR